MPNLPRELFPARTCVSGCQTRPATARFQRRSCRGHIQATCPRWVSRSANGKGTGRTPPGSKPRTTSDTADFDRSVWIHAWFWTSYRLIAANVMKSSGLIRAAAPVGHALTHAAPPFKSLHMSHFTAFFMIGFVAPPAAVLGPLVLALDS